MVVQDYALCWIDVGITCGSSAPWKLRPVEVLAQVLYRPVRWAPGTLNNVEL